MGGRRENSGRKKKLDIEKKKEITIYMKQQEIDFINATNIGKSLSEKCVNYIELGIKKYKEELNDKIRFIDLFSGLGGIRIGLEEAFREMNIKTECVFSSEIKKHAVKVYNENFKDSNMNGDISKIEAENIPDFDILLAGFPCQPFSSAGKRLGFNDTRGTLFFEIERILESKKPYAFILENVEGLINHNNGETLKIIINSLVKLGYSVNYKLIDSMYFGLAQSRKRVYIVGTKEEKINLENFDKKLRSFKEIQERDKETLESEFTKKLLKKFSIEELYGKSIKDKRGGKNNIHSWDIEIKGKVSDKQKKLLEKILKERRKKIWAEKIGIKWMDGMPLTLNQIRTFYDDDKLKEMLDDLVEKKYIVLEYPKKLENKKRVYDETKEKGYNIVSGKLSFEFSKILNPNDITPTLVATDISKLGVIDKKGIRKLTLREGLRLFGFPENYNLDSVSYNEGLDLLGNTVCVPVIREIAKRIGKKILQKESYSKIKNY